MRQQNHVVRVRKKITWDVNSTIGSLTSGVNSDSGSLTPGVNSIVGYDRLGFCHDAKYTNSYNGGSTFGANSICQKINRSEGLV